MRKAVIAFFAMTLIGVQGGADGCGGDSGGETAATPPAPGAPNIPEGERQPQPQADPQPNKTDRYITRHIIFETDPPGLGMSIVYGVQPGQRTRESEVTSPVTRIVHVPVGPMSVLIADGELLGNGTIRCRFFNPETQTETADKRVSGYRKVVTCLESFVQ
jgi:hypothetical protein